MCVVEAAGDRAGHPVGGGNRGLPPLLQPMSVVRVRINDLDREPHCAALERGYVNHIFKSRCLKPDGRSRCCWQFACGRDIDAIGTPTAIPIPTATATGMPRIRLLPPDRDTNG